MEAFSSVNNHTVLVTDVALFLDFAKLANPEALGSPGKMKLFYWVMFSKAYPSGHKIVIDASFQK